MTMSPEAKRLIDLIRRNDCQRMAAMIDRMRSTLGSRGLDCDVDEQAVVEMIVAPARQCPGDRLSAGAAYFAGVSGSDLSAGTGAGARSVG